MTPERCAQALDDALQRNPTVKFLVDALAKAGCPVTRRFFSVETCDAKVVGGFRPGDGVRACRACLRWRVWRATAFWRSPLARAGGDVSQPHPDRHRV